MDASPTEDAEEGEQFLKATTEGRVTKVGHILAPRLSTQARSTVHFHLTTTPSSLLAQFPFPSFEARRSEQILSPTLLGELFLLFLHGYKVALFFVFSKGRILSERSGNGNLQKNRAIMIR